MKKLFKISLVAIIAILSTSISYGQEWSKAQQEVWKTVENEWNLWKAGDVAGMTAILHEKYQGWNTHDPLPVNKLMVVEHFTQMKEMFKVTSMSINPARIAVTDNSAVADYFFTFSYSMGEGDSKKSEDMKGRIVECYTKEGGKWLLLGDMMAFDEDEDEGDD